MSRLGIRACSALAVSLLAVSAASAEDARAVHLNQTGFLQHGPKRATVVTDAAKPFAWTLETAGGAVAASGETTPFGFGEDAGHAVHTVDFSAFDETGDGFVLKADGAESAPFAIAADLYRPLKYDALAFFYHQRSGIEIDADLVGAEWARPAAYAPDMATSEKKYRNGAVAVTDYRLGRNPLSQSYISGYGENPMKAPHHRFWAKAADPSLPGPPPGALAGGPNESTAPDPIIKRIHSDCVAQTCYADEIEAYLLNEVAINWNALLFWIATFLDEEESRERQP